jgi:hypothetical protein
MRFSGKAAAERLLEGIDIVDALADERAFAEQILIDVGDGAGVRVDARFAAVQAGIARAVGARQADATRGCRMP